MKRSIEIWSEELVVCIGFVLKNVELLGRDV